MISPQVLPGLRRAVARHQLGDLLLGDVAGGQLRAQVAQHHDGHAHVLLQERDERLVVLARLVELQGRMRSPSAKISVESDALEPATRPPTSV